MSKRLTALNENIQLEVIPEFGGRVGWLMFRGKDVFVPLLGDDFDPVMWPRAGAYPMIPYHNRIADGLLTFEGQQYEVASHKDAEPNSLHGPAHRDRWSVVSQSEQEIVLEVTRDADVHWPWAFTGRQSFYVMENGIKLVLSVANRSPERMPAGLGWHPYVLHPRDVVHDAEFSWSMGAGYLPTGERATVAHHLPAPVTSTEYLSCWSNLQVDLASGLMLSIAATPVLSHLVLHKGDGDYLCVEPVSHLANGFNLHDSGILGTGARVLGPGEELSAMISLTISRRG